MHSNLLQIFAYIYLCRPGTDKLPQATEINVFSNPQKSTKVSFSIKPLAPKDRFFIQKYPPRPAWGAGVLDGAEVSQIWPKVCPPSPRTAQKSTQGDQRVDWDCLFIHFFWHQISASISACLFSRIFRILDRFWLPCWLHFGIICIIFA